MTRATSQTKQRELTFEEYMTTPVTKRRQEVIDGVIVMSPTPTVRHQIILQNVYDGTSPHVRNHELGTVIIAPSDLVIRRTPKLRVRQPDLMFFAYERASRETLMNLKILEITPDLAVEILSPSDRPKRWSEKLADYASIQVPELWRIESEDESVEVHRLVEGHYLLQGRFQDDEVINSWVLPRLELRVSALFQ